MVNTYYQSPKPELVLLPSPSFPSHSVTFFYIAAVDSCSTISSVVTAVVSAKIWNTEWGQLSGQAVSVLTAVVSDNTTLHTAIHTDIHTAIHTAIQRAQRKIGWPGGRLTFLVLLYLEVWDCRSLYVLVYYI